MRILNIILPLLVLIIITADPCFAGTFSEKFRRFVLGPEAEAYSIEGEESILADDCMRCHNGTTAVQIAIKDSEAPYQISGHQTLNHPLGMSYDRYALRDPRGYRPKPFLDENIQLVDGKVWCVSCHRLKKDLPEQILASRDFSGKEDDCTGSGQLTLGPRKTDLCLGCHIK